MIFLWFRIQSICLDVPTCSCLCSSPQSRFLGALQPSRRYQRTKGSSCRVSGGLRFKCFSTPQPAFRHASFLSAPPQIQKLLSEFPDFLSSEGFTASKPQHGVRHHLLTNPGPPVYSKPCGLDPDKLSTAKAEFPPWRRQELFTDVLLPGRHLSTW